MKKTSLLNLFLMLILCACATWAVVGGQYKMDSQNYQVDLPQGWRKFNPATGVLLITKDGFSLQQIHISRLEIGKELPHTKKKLTAGMLPQEAAEVIIDNLRSNTGIMSQKILENSPAQIGGHSGFKIVYTYQDRAGLNKKGIICGFLLDNWFYEILYEAAERYYFAKDLQDFEKVKESFSLIKDATS
jgi:hypothetical protein